MTLRELLWMAEARGRADWSRTSVILALIANIHRDPKKTRAFKPTDFNPYRLDEEKSNQWEILKAVFVNHGNQDSPSRDRRSRAPFGDRVRDLGGS